ncbi:MAG: thiamine phosphate synthase [Betaproteobacteria bacterium]|nr:thiamine phosphate synthase [Betaproteobacteria bacterium]
MKAAIKGLYAVTPDIVDTTELLAKVEAALAGGARLLQYRNKTASAALRLLQARALHALAREYSVPLIVNDHLDLATAVDAAGLHLGREDGSLGEARARLGPEKLLGVSCYNRLENALDAAHAGANYVAFGSFFPSAVKPGAPQAPLALLGEARRRISLPVVAIGGDNAPQLIAAGADAVAVISALFGAPDIRAAAQRLSALFPGHE